MNFYPRICFENLSDLIMWREQNNYCSLFYGEIQYETNLRILKWEANFLNVKCGGRFTKEIEHELHIFMLKIIFLDLLYFWYLSQFIRQFHNYKYLKKCLINWPALGQFSKAYDITGNWEHIFWINLYFAK